METTERTQKVRYYRQQKGLSQRALAQELGVKQPEIAQLEKRSSSPALEKWLKMADFFGVSVQELYGWTPKELDTSPENI